MPTGVAVELFERERELEQLDAALSAVLAGEGRVVVVQGSPGIGKSRLVDALCARANDSARVLRGRGGEQERESPLAVVRELFEPAVLRANEAERSRLLAGAAGLAGPLLGLGPGEGTTVDSAFAVMHGLYWLTANLADEGPLVLAVDDAHWTDVATQRWLAYLIPRIAELPVLLALAFRPRELDPTSTLAGGLAGAPEAVLVEPGALGFDGVASLVADALGQPEAEFCAALQRSTGGNPLLVRTLVSALVAKGVSPTAAQSERLHSVGIDRIGRIVLPRMHRLGRAAVDLARAAAVLGEGATLAEAAGLAGLDGFSAETAVDALVGAEVLRADRSLGFVHPLVRAAVLDELQPGAKADLHRRAARSMNASGQNSEDVARQLLACEPVMEAWAFRALREAGELAVERGAPEAAIRFFERGLREQPQGDTRATLVLELGKAAYHARHPSALSWLREAVECATDSTIWTNAFIEFIAATVYSGGRVPTGLVEAAPPLGDEHRLVISALAMGGGAASSTLPRPVRPPEVPSGVSPFERIWLSRAALVEVLTCGRASRAVTLADHALAEGDLLAEAGDKMQYAWVIMALCWSGQLARALRECVRALEFATRRGSLVAFEWCTLGLGLTNAALGELADAESHMEVALETETGNFVIGAPLKASVYVDVLRERGRYAAAEILLTGRDLLEGRSPSHHWDARLLESRGRVHLARGQVAEALTDMRACGESLRALSKPNNAAYGWRAGAAECLAALGEREEAMELAREQVADARSFGAAPWLGSSLRALGVVCGDADGVELLREAVEVLSASDAKLEYAHALCDLGVLLRLNRHPRDAREPLRQALDLAERCGAHPLADRASEELSAAGARPRRRAISGADSLTAAERRVASLAAQGKSNPQIAQSLFVTRKTVEKHLGNAFLKLQITSRAQLAAALNAQR